MARGVPCLSCGGSVFALLVFCACICLWGWVLLSRVSGGERCTWTVVQVVRTAFLQGLAEHGAYLEFTRLCVGRERSWVCGLLLVDGVFALRPLRPVQLHRGDGSNTRSLWLLYISKEVLNVKVLNTVPGAE